MRTSSCDLRKINSLLLDRWETIRDTFSLELEESTKYLTGICPIHYGSDNHTAFNLNKITGNWRCYTHKCESVFHPSMIGLIRGLLSVQRLEWSDLGDKLVDFGETLKFCRKIIGNVPVQINNRVLEKRRFVKMISKNADINTRKIKREVVRNFIKIPSTYYLERGYDRDVLLKYDIGYCDNPKSSMFQRIVVPVYDKKCEFMIGCTGRSIFEQCLACDQYHNPKQKCPADRAYGKYSKWKHSLNFSTSSVLYNLNFAYGHIASENEIILVEGPSDVWKLEEAGVHNSLAIFGSSLSLNQISILNSLPATRLKVMLDDDNAGNSGFQEIQRKLGRTYTIERITPEGDPGDMKTEDLKNLCHV